MGRKRSGDGRGKNDETVSSIIWAAIAEKIFTTQNVNVWCQNPPKSPKENILKYRLKISVF